MNQMVVAWVAIAGALAARSFVRPSYAIGLYMMTFLVAPHNWWWGDLVEGYRWNFYAGILLLLTVLMTKDEDKGTQERPFSSNAVPILLLMVVNMVFVHLALAVNSDTSIGWVIARCKFILLFFLLQYAIRDQKDFRIAALAVTLGMGYIGYEATINERGSFNGGRLEGIGAAGVSSSNQLASLLVTGLPLSVTLLFTDISKKAKALVLLCGGFTFNVVLLCNSRGAFLGLLAGGAVFLFMASGPARKQSAKVIGLALVATFLLLGDMRIVDRFMTTFTSEGQRDSSAQSRIVFWTAASEMLMDYPLGSGGNSFSEGRGWLYLEGGDRRPGLARAIHNGFLTEATDWGVQGFLITMGFLGVIVLTLLRGRRLAIEAGDGHAVMVFACIATAMTAWCVSSVFGDYLNDEWGFWVAAFAYSYLRVRLFAPAEASAPVAAEPEGPTTTWTRPLPHGVGR